MPLLAIGKDIYIDSRLILSKLEALYPDSILAPSTPADTGIRKLFENYNTDGGIFANTVKLMPYWEASGVLQNKVFLDDRQKLSGGRRMTAQAMEMGRPDALQHMRQAFELMETTFLADGRKWILNSEGPTVADIDAVWPLSWLIADRGMKGSLPETYFSEKIYPKTYAWVHRFMNEVAQKKKQTRPPNSLDGPSMKTRVSDTTSPLEATTFADSDPLDLQPGQQVEVYPTDYGQAHKDRGALVGLSTTEAVIRNTQNLHLHFPRWNFRITTPSPPKGGSKI
jgi:glutathione S-transferase